MKAMRQEAAGGPRDLRDELEHFDGTYPEAWQPDPGEILVGEILRVEKAPSRFGHGQVWVAVIEREEGLGVVSVWLTSAVLLREFRKHRPQVGERIGIKYLGMREGKENSYKAFAVRLDRPEETPDYRELGGEEDGDGRRRAAGGGYEEEPWPEEA